MKQLSDLKRIFSEQGHAIKFGCSEAEYEKMVELCCVLGISRSLIPASRSPQF